MSVETEIEVDYIQFPSMETDTQISQLALKLLERSHRALRHLKLPQQFFLHYVNDMPAFPALLHLEIFYLKGYLPPTRAPAKLQCNNLETFDCSRASVAFELLTLGLSFKSLKTYKVNFPVPCSTYSLNAMERLENFTVSHAAYTDLSRLSMLLVTNERRVETYKSVFTDFLAKIPKRIGFKVRIFDDRIFEEDVLSFVAHYGKFDEGALRSMTLAALDLGMSPRTVAKFCIHQQMWDMILECFQRGLSPEERLEGGDTIFVALCATNPPLRVLTQIFCDYLDKPKQRVEFSSDLLLDASGSSVLTTAALSDLSIASFDWLLDTVSVYGIDVNTRGLDGDTALDKLCKLSASIEPTRFIRAKARILIDRGSNIGTAMSFVAGSVLCELVNLFLEGKISLLEHLTGHEEPLLNRICVCDVKSQTLVGMERLHQVQEAIRRLLQQAEAAYGQDRVVEIISQRDKYSGYGVLEECLLAAESYSGSWDPLCADRIKAICAAIPSKNQRSQFVNIPGSQYGLTPLHRAAGLAYHRVIDQLIIAGADVNSLCNGDTALACVLTSFQSRAEILQSVRILLHHGASATTPSVVLTGLRPLQWILRFLGTRGVVVVLDSSDSEEDGGVRGVRAEMRQRRKRRYSRNQVISVESDYDSDSVDESSDELYIKDVQSNSGDENDLIEWNFEDEMVQIAHLLLESTPVQYLNEQLTDGQTKKYALAYLGDMCDRGDESAAIALLQCMMKKGLDLTLPAHREILQSWRKKRSKLALLSSISTSRKLNSNKKQKNRSRPVRARSFGLFQEDEDDDDGFQHWL
eukprot:TRINITY_DN3787_c0_g1_i1.p1 TRINITY_DN3787_c0_g1~~TRINITY_DN3787_c0_g1_i1.p1  ORF type:complete len:895 (-),score=104.71 TRINITY_DN3787_c0_g1_i1:1045-3465(-)